MSDKHDESASLATDVAIPEQSRGTQPPVGVPPPLRYLPTALGMSFGCAVCLGVLCRMLYGQWQSMPAFLTTLLLIAAAAIPLVEWGNENTTAKQGAALGMLLGLVIGAVYGAIGGSFMVGLLFTACLGTGIGWAVARYGTTGGTDSLSKRIAAALACVVVLLHFTGALSFSLKRPSTPGAVVSSDTPPGNTPMPLEAIADAASEKTGAITPSVTPPRDAGRRAYSKEEIRALCDKAESLALGVKSDTVFSVLGEPSVVRDGEWHDWLTRPDDKRYRVTVGIEGDVVKSIDWSDGSLFGAEEMIDLLKKAQILRIGQSRGSVLQEMGRASSEKKYSTRLVDQIDFVTNQVTWKEDKRSLLVWQSADAEERSVMVSLKEGGVDAVRCHQPGRGVVYKLEE